MSYCNMCGAGLPDQDARFCLNCGAAVASAPASAPAAAPVPVGGPAPAPAAAPASAQAPAPRGGRTGLLILAIVIGVMVVAGAAVGVFFAFRGSDSETEPTTTSEAYSSLGHDETTTTEWAETTVAETEASQQARWETAGTSVRGTPIQMLTVGTGSWRVLVIGGMQGDGYSAAVGGAFADYIRADPSVVPADTQLRVIPCLNPDAVATWSRGNANAVDINRNFPSANWRSTLDSRDSSSKTCSGGFSPGSEPETQVVMSALEEGFDLVIVIYNPGRRIDYDGGASGSVIAYQMAGASGLSVGKPSNSSFITGSIGLYVPQAYGKWVVSLGNDGNTLTTPVTNALVAALTRPSGL